MAKTKISELEKQYGIDRKDIIAFLNEQGIEAKTANSSIEDDAVSLVVKRFVPDVEKKQPAAGSQPAQTADADRTAEKPAPAKRPDAAGAPGREGQPVQPQKKKKIIFVTGQGSAQGQKATQGKAYTGGSYPGTGSYGKKPGRPQDRQADNRGQKGRMQAQQAYHPIKPITVPSTMEVDYHKPQPQPKAKAPEKEAAENLIEKTADVIQQPAVSNPEEQNAAVNTAPVSTEERPAETAEAVTAHTEEPAAAPAAAVPSDDASEKKTETAVNAENESQAQVNTGERKPVRRNDGARQQGQPARSDGDMQRRDDRRGGTSSAPGRDRSAQTGYGNRNGQNQGRPARPGSAPFRNQGAQGGQAAQGQTGGQGGRGGQRQAGTAQPGRDRRTQGARPEGTSRKDNPADKRRDDKRKNVQEKDRHSRKDLIYQQEDEPARKNRAGRFIKPEKKAEEVVEEQIKVISIPEKITLRELAEKMRMQPAEIIKKLFLQGQVTTVNSELTYEEAEAIAVDYDILCEKEQKVDVIEELLKEEDDPEETLKDRAPVICVMGHVDHGKTSLLDAIRNSNVTGKEAGGITQHIGAYTVSVDGRMITFLDTPGHEAFTAMRMRGANSTDIAVLVIAADDGVMPQTVEAINHAKAAGVEIIVAVNKIDKPDANPERVKQEMTEYELVPTEWGGSTEFVNVSAKTGEGLDTLLETILLTADIMELKANPDRKARGLVLEAKLDKGRGPVANVLIQKGTLHAGDYISAGASHGRVRAMIDDKGRKIKEAGPSTPVEVLGLSDVPGACEIILAHDEEKTAKSYAETYKVQHKADLIEDTKMRMSLDDLFNQMKEGTLKEFNLILKADVQGSVEALRQSLLKLSNDEVLVKVIHAGVGNITESDISLASASNAVIIGFNVRMDAIVKSMADSEGVDVRLYSVIYQAIDDVEAALKGMLAPVYEEKIIGHAEIRQIFKASAVGNIAGSYITDGTFQRGCKIRLRRDGELIYEGSLASLKRFKDDVKEVREGFECGLVFDGFDKIAVGDIAEGYILVEVPRT
ncbi:MAG: translation initiation factor IF-2 [Lachnospiraceae bacterium]|nr:translation initiation factor IF-2 [Lachnospiraceae bacterium]